MLIPGMLARRAVKGELPLIAAAKKLQDEILSPSRPSVGFGDTSPLDEALQTIDAFRKVVLLTLGTAMQNYGDTLSDQQEVLSYIADIVCDTYAAESAVLRAGQAAADRHKDALLHEAAARVFINDAAQRVEAAARSALAGMAEGDTLRTLLAALRRILKVTPINTIALRRALADAAIQRGGYILS
jgi:alkylation response protein AidB-like acyl-CoA dehydrogenase